MPRPCARQLIRGLTDLNLVELRGVIASMEPARARGTLVRGTLDALDMESVPALYSVDSSSADSTNELLESLRESVRATGYDYLLREPDGEAQQALRKEFEKAAATSLTLVVSTVTTDVAAFIRAHGALITHTLRSSTHTLGIASSRPFTAPFTLPKLTPPRREDAAGKLFAEKTRRVVIMGGVDPATLGSSTAEFLLPDETASNFKLDMASAAFIFRSCQEMKVQLVVTTRAASAAAPLPSFVYDELATLGHPVSSHPRRTFGSSHAARRIVRCADHYPRCPRRLRVRVIASRAQSARPTPQVALRLREGQRESIQSLWRRSNMPVDHPSRQGLPSRLDREWFIKTFCGGADLSHVSR